jgi:stress response protein SCP2
MIVLAPGANAAIPALAMTVQIRHDAILGADLDVSAFLLAANGKVRSDADMCFYGQTVVGNGAVALAGSVNGQATFSVNLGQLPAGVEKVVFTATIHENRATFGQLALPITANFDDIQGKIPCAGMTETALILAELYRRSGVWKVRVVGQGFNGGLAALARHLGVEIAESVPMAASNPVTPSSLALPASASSIRLEKKLVDLQKKDPELLSLVKKVQVSLEKRQLLTDRAKVALCLDISGSMDSLYRSGKIDTLVRRVMALGYRFDDDGEIDAFLFGERAHEWGAISVNDYRDFISSMRRRHNLEGGTRYAEAMKLIRSFYRKNNREGLPVYIMFVTDGDTSSRPMAEQEMREASVEPIFWQFMGLGGGGFFSSAFDFLEKLNQLPGRAVDNANFFKLQDPSKPTDEEMFELMMGEYPQWLKIAQSRGILRI